MTDLQMRFQSFNANHLSIYLLTYLLFSIPAFGEQVDYNKITPILDRASEASKSGDFKQAFEIIKPIKSMDADSYLQAKAAVFEDKGELKSAEKLLSEKLKKKPLCLSYLDRAKFYERHSDFQKALTDFNSAATGNNPIFFNARAFYFARRGNFASAHADVNRAMISGDADNNWNKAMCNVNHGQIYEMQGELSLAYDCFFRAAKEWTIEEKEFKDFKRRHPDAQSAAAQAKRATEVKRAAASAQLKRDQEIAAETAQRMDRERQTESERFQERLKSRQ